MWWSLLSGRAGECLRGLSAVDVDWLNLTLTATAREAARTEWADPLCFVGAGREDAHGFS